MNMAGTLHGELLELSERMLAAARSGDWDAVAALETERSEQLSSLSVTEPTALPVLQALVAYTEEVRVLAGRQRDQLGEDLGLHKHRHRALSAYLHAGFD
jgi:flagellar protein FliT